MAALLLFDEVKKKNQMLEVLLYVCIKQEHKTGNRLGHTVADGVRDTSMLQTMT